MLFQNNHKKCHADSSIQYKSKYQSILFTQYDKNNLNCPLSFKNADLTKNNTTLTKFDKI